MTEPQDEAVSPEPTVTDAAQRQVSRRAMVRAGLVAVPVLMTLPTVSAWAQTNQSANSAFCRAGINAQTSSCAAARTFRNTHAEWKTKKNPPLTGPNTGPAAMTGQQDPDGVFGPSPFKAGGLGENPFQNP